MNIVAIRVLRAYWQRRPTTESHLRAWIAEAQAARWTQPAEIKAQYHNASILKNRRAVFNIQGNKHRLVVALAYRQQAIYVKFIGTHEEYDAIDAETVELEI